ncbi:MAG: hypothetical protein U0324_06450 [Polyangiales bacterium]
MHPGLAHVIRDYQRVVARVVAMLEAVGIPRPASNTAWAGASVPWRGDLGGGVRYHKHGYGCAAQARSWHVDFDFGDVGQIDGFDAWRLAGFAGGKLAKYGFASVDDLRRAFAAAVDAGELRHSGYILYYLADPEALRDARGPRALSAVRRGAVEGAPAVVLHSKAGVCPALAPMVERFIAEGVPLVSVVGVDCAQVEEVIDELVVGDGRADDRFLLTSSHPGESLEEAVAFARAFRAGLGEPRVVVL